MNTAFALLVAAIGATLAAARIHSSTTASTFGVAAVQLTPISAWSPLEAAVQSALAASEIVYNLASGNNVTLVRGDADVIPDLVVFPEHGLLGNFTTELCGSPAGVELFNSGCVSVPPVGGGFWCGALAPTPLSIIACGMNASNYSNTFISVSVCELCQGDTSAHGPCAVSQPQTPTPPGKQQNTTAYFNTQVILQGPQVMAVYRKVNTVSTGCYDTPVVKASTLKIKGRKFGLFTGDDIYHAQPVADLVKDGADSFIVPADGITRGNVTAFSKTHHAAVVYADKLYGQTSIAVNGTILAACKAADTVCAAVARL
jgi:hypothetical protein